MDHSIDKTPAHPGQGGATGVPDDLGGPPADVADHWCSAGVIPPDARWVPLTGGRTNAVWRVEPQGGIGAATVCKLYRPGGDTPVFANDPDGERAALTALDGTGLGPRLIASGETASGVSLVYGHIDGRGWHTDDDLAQVARAFARLHAQPVPADLPDAPTGGAALRAQTLAMLETLGADGRALVGCDPGMPADQSHPRPVLLHGDATPGNILVTAAGVTFIDWQCPARGDPVDDLAIFLSPAMQAISGNAPLSQAGVGAFLAAYGDETVARRYRALAPLYHWRMAAYCLWRAARGDAGYDAAGALEVAALRGSTRPR